MGGWQIYNGKIWERDSNEQIKSFAIQAHSKLIRDLDAMPEHTPDEVKIKDAFSKHVKATGTNGKLEAMLDCAKPFLAKSAAEFDNKSNLFNCDNMTLHLDTRIRGDFLPTDFLTKISPITYDPDSKCPLWEQFLTDIFQGDQEIVKFMQRAVGYSMTPATKEQCMFILYGHGRNGKSTFLKIISTILGTYCCHCPATAFIRKQNGTINNDIARLKGMRFVTSTENNENVTLDEALIKSLTGDDKIAARFLHCEFFDFYPTFKIFLSTNHKPNIRGTDPGIWRRIRMIPFNLNISKEKEDVNLSTKLQAELPGILKWALLGYREWEKLGLQTPQVIWDATKEYQDEEDIIGQFIEDQCILGSGDDFYISCQDFKARFKLINGWVNQKSLADYMRRKGLSPMENRIYRNGSEFRAFTGLRFKSSAEKIMYD